MTPRTSSKDTAAEKDEGKNTQERVKCVIVGAGASGLQCANRLIREYGYAPKDVLILEARDRVGGRIQTTREERTTVSGDKVEFPLDHGAAWVHGTGVEWGTSSITGNSDANPMMELLQAVTPPTENVYEQQLNHVFSGNPWMRPKTIGHDAGEMALFVAGQRIASDSPVVTNALRNYFHILDQVSDVGVEMYGQDRGMETTTQSLQETIQQVRAPVNTGTENECELVERITDFHLHLIECWEGSSASELQLCQHTKDDSDDDVEFDEVYTEEGDFAGPHCTLQNGMITVLEPLLQQDIVGRIRLNEEVRKIAVQDEGTSIRVETSSGLTVISDCCVLTLTVGCLQDAIGHKDVFHPKLSDVKLEAIGAMKMGSYKKVFLTFDRIFWPANEAILGLVRKIDVTGDVSPLGNTLLFDNLWARDGIPCIEAVLVGNVGLAFSHKGNDEIQASVLHFMQEALGVDGDLKEYCQSCHVTRWEEDLYSKGAYSHMSLGALSRHVDELRHPEWDGRLVLAGEATVLEYEGSVHAALFSGRNAASSIHSRLLSLPTPNTRYEKISTCDAAPTSLATERENAVQ